MTGWPGRRAFEVDEIRPAPRGPPRPRRALSSWTTGAKRVLVMLLNFTDDSSFNATTVTNTQSLFFGTGSSVANYYAEASYGLVSMTGDVVLVTATVAKPTTCDTGVIQTQANARAQGGRQGPRELRLPRLGLPLDRRLRLERPRLRRRRRLVDQRRAVGVVGPPRRGPRARPQFRRPARALVRLRGSLRSRRRAARAAITATGSTRWAIRAPGHFNAQFKDTFGWLPAGTVKVHGGGSATYTLGPLEAPGQIDVCRQDPDDRHEPGADVLGRVPGPHGLRRGRARDDRERRPHPDRAELRSRPPRHDARDVDVRRRRSSTRRSSFTDPAGEPQDHDALEDGDVPHDPGRLRRAAARDGLPHAGAVPGLRHAQRRTGPYGGPALFAGQTRSWVVRGRCGVPATAKSIAGQPHGHRARRPRARVRLAPGGTLRDGHDDRQLPRRPDAREQRRGRRSGRRATSSWTGSPPEPRT